MQRQRTPRNEEVADALAASLKIWLGLTLADLPPTDANRMELIFLFLEHAALLTIAGDLRPQEEMCERAVIGAEEAWNVLKRLWIPVEN